MTYSQSASASKTHKGFSLFVCLLYTHQCISWSITIWAFINHIRIQHNSRNCDIVENYSFPKIPKFALRINQYHHNFYTFSSSSGNISRNKFRSEPFWNFITEALSGIHVFKYYFSEIQLHLGIRHKL